jgi:hypothetical protein
VEVGVLWINVSNPIIEFASVERWEGKRSSNLSLHLVYLPLFGFLDMLEDLVAVWGTRETLKAKVDELSG